MNTASVVKEDELIRHLADQLLKKLLRQEEKHDSWPGYSRRRDRGRFSQPDVVAESERAVKTPWGW